MVCIVSEINRAHAAVRRNKPFFFYVKCPSLLNVLVARLGNLNHTVDFLLFVTIHWLHWTGSVGKKLTVLFYVHSFIRELSTSFLNQEFKSAKRKYLLLCLPSQLIEILLCVLNSESSHCLKRSQDFCSEF